ncbi:hypothetical protein NHX12_026723 [Muraenolepis orangiensis]|uniref:Tudor domain-containing protein n=1 Tax=Muraenolepis orangiensis TaxID=630683 RepID=A0A9Q0IR24_9TELE|nr:hypothetical protein NHX12_026723 [Muraenolepis orangiensis]
MSERLTACHSTINNPNQMPQDSLGLLCSVKGKDDKWYRGFVQCLPVNSQVKVLFVDFGFSESVRVENILGLPPDFLSMPIMAFQCTLSSVTEQNKDWKHKQVCLLKKGILSGVLNAKVISLDEKLNIYSIEILEEYWNKDSTVKAPELIQALSILKHEAVSKCAQVSPQGGNLCCETIMAHVLHSSLQAEGLTTDSKFVGYVVHAINPNNFSLRTEKRNSDFEDLMKQLSEHFSQVKLNEQVLENPELGTMCCAMYEHDMQFYRAVVKRKLDFEAEVLFIDFGNTAKVPYMQIKKVPEKFVSKAAFAFNCTLHNVMPLTDVWALPSSQFFRQAVADRSLAVHFIHKRKDNVVVDLFTMEGKTNQSITELLISCKQAEPWKCTQSVKPHQNVISMEEKALEKLVCTLTQKVTPTVKDPTTIKTLQLKLGSEMPVRCTYFKCPSEFWCQVSDNLSVLQELMAKIQQYYSTHTVPVQVGARFCISKSPGDGKWYRAYIIERKSSRHISVLLVDNGKTLQVEEHTLQQILPEYCELEAQAFRCSLYNLIESINPKICGEWGEEECTLFRDFVQYHSASLTCSLTSLLWVTSKGLCAVVDLHSSQLQHSITELLIKQGLARPLKIQSKCSSSAYPVSFSYSSFNLSCGNKELVYVTHISRAWDIYCQLDRNSEIIEKLETKISEEEKILWSDNSAKSMCLAKYFDGRWYRGLAKPTQSSLYLSVFFVDYGNTCIVEKTQVVSIPHHSVDLLYTSVQAVRCSLARVPKTEPLTCVMQWLKETLLNGQVRADVVGKLEDGSLTVELFNGDVHINNLINEHIDKLTQTHSQQDKRVSPAFNTTHRKPQDNRLSPTLNTTHRQQQDGRLSPTLNTTHRKPQDRRSPTLKTTHRKPQDGRRSPTLNTTNRQQQDKRLSPTLNTIKEHQILPTMPTISNTRLKSGLKALCYASHINTVSDFFLQLQEDEIHILKMREVLNCSVSIASLVKSTFSELEINNSVLAEYDDGALYRAVIKGSEGNCFKVEFVDYGNLSVVGKDKIYSMTPCKMMVQPRFSIPCTLLNTSTNDEEDTFRDAITDKSLRVEFVGRVGTQWKVKIEIIEENSFSVLVPKKQEVCELTLKETKEGNKSEEVTVSTKDNIPESSDMPTKSKLTMCSQKPGRMPDETNGSMKSCRISESSDVRGDIVDAFRPAYQELHWEQGTLLSVLQNGHFYVRLHKTEDRLLTIESLIATHLNECDTLPIEQVQEGLKCLVKGPKDRWSRAVVVHVDQPKCWTFLLDHGLTTGTTCGSLRKFHCDIAHISGLAVLCKLNNHSFVVTVESLRQLIGKDLNVLFKTHSDSDNLRLVEITLNKSFIQQAEMTNSGQLSEDINPIPRETTTRNYKDEQIRPGTSLPQQLSFAPINMGQVYCGFATAVTSPFDFYIVLEDSLLIMKEVSAMLEELPSEMPPLPEAHLVPGSCCLVYSDTKGKWCRAEVVNAEKTVVINLVDYGHYTYLAYSSYQKVKILPEALQKLPKVTYPCSLRGVNPTSDTLQWADEAAVFFQKRVCQKNLQIFFWDDGHWEVDVLVDGIHLSKELVDAGHGSYVDVLLGLR